MEPAHAGLGGEGLMPVLPFVLDKQRAAGVRMRLSCGSADLAGVTRAMQQFRMK